MNELFTLYRENDIHGYYQLEVGRQGRMNWHIQMTLLSTGEPIVDVEEPLMELAFSKAYTRMLEHFHRLPLSK